MEDNYKSLTKLLVVFLGILLATQAFAQTKLSGKVTTTQGDPLPGVNVLVKGTAQGTTTDSRGVFQIEVNQADVVLTFSFIDLFF